MVKRKSRPQTEMAVKTVVGKKIRRPSACGVESYCSDQQKMERTKIQRRKKMDI